MACWVGGGFGSCAEVMGLTSYDVVVPGSPSRKVMVVYIVAFSLLSASGCAREIYKHKAIYILFPEHYLSSTAYTRIQNEYHQILHELGRVQGEGLQRRGEEGDEQEVRSTLYLLDDPSLTLYSIAKDSNVRTSTRIRAAKDAVKNTADEHNNKRQADVHRESAKHNY